MHQYLYCCSGLRQLCLALPWRDAVRFSFGRVPTAASGVLGLPLWQQCFGSQGTQGSHCQHRPSFCTACRSLSRAPIAAGSSCSPGTTTRSGHVVGRDQGLQAARLWLSEFAGKALAEFCRPFVLTLIYCSAGEVRHHLGRERSGGLCRQGKRVSGRVVHVMAFVSYGSTYEGEALLAGTPAPCLPCRFTYRPLSAQ